MIHPPVDVVKTFTPRGPLHQYRLGHLEEFRCLRCGGSKKSKLVTTADGHPDGYVCNGCYGRLLSLWDLKAGDLPDAERDAAILKLLGAMVPAEAIEQERLRLAQTTAARRWGDDTQRVVATALAVRDALLNATSLDWSAAVIGLCKGVEIEMGRRLLEPLAEELQGADLGEDLKDKDLSRLARFCVGKAPAPELGALAYVLNVAARSKRRAATSPVLIALLGMVQTWRDGLWVVASDGLPARLQKFCTDYRNRAAHTSILTESDFEACLQEVTGEDGLLTYFVEASLPKQLP